MKRPANLTQFDLMGYQPYQFVSQFAGSWTPVYQQDAETVGKLSMFKTTQKKPCLSDPTEAAMTYQGITLLYLEKNCSMKAFFASKVELDKIASRPDNRNQQSKYGVAIAARRAIMDPQGNIKCRLLHAEKAPHMINIDEIFNAIENSDANVFVLTGYGDGEWNGKYYETAHIFLIANDGRKWKFFEPLRGEVAFASLAKLKSWFIKEVTKGVLKEFGARYPVPFREGATRRYTQCTLDSYQKQFAMKQGKPGASTPGNS